MPLLRSCGQGTWKSKGGGKAVALAAWAAKAKGKGSVRKKLDFTPAAEEVFSMFCVSKTSLGGMPG